MSDEFRAHLRQLPGRQRRYEQSAARLRVHETFDDIAAAKARGVTWQAIADLMNADGLRGTEGTPLTAAQVAALYTSEKLARGGRKPRRKPKAAAPEPAPAPAGTPAVTPPLDPPDDEPRRRKFVLPKTTRK